MICSLPAILTDPKIAVTAGRLESRRAPNQTIPVGGFQEMEATDDNQLKNLRKIQSNKKE